MANSAILGGDSVRETPIAWANTMGDEELVAVVDVMRSGVLSAFVADAGDDFLGGPRVRQMEADFCGRFRSGHAISVNSATTALQTAVAACGIGPGDEVLVSPYTMVASASAILMNGAVPVFVDVDPELFTIDINEIEKWISPHTKAILTVNIFGLPSNLPEIMRIAKEHGLYVIEDNAQAPGATIEGKEAGTFGDIGIYSLNYHKVIHSGEGGVIVTDNDDLARRCQLIRNHGELALDQLGDINTWLVGNNIRMSELHAAIGIEQLKKLDGFLKLRRLLAEKIMAEFDKRDGLRGARVPEGYTHSYYVYPFLYDKKIWGMSRHTFAMAMEAEGFPVGEGYVKPIHLMNIYKHQHVFNSTTYPFSFISKPTQEYRPGLLPVVEELYEETLLIADICRIPYTERDIDDFFRAIDKIWDERKDIAVKCERN